ncbi:hypothetical protein [Brevibacillus sp. AY1]|uniref:hypothetical protein n=1 Tax=Brevibacillus sp. AY1 TaxID=2807621 RepID=UPI00245770DD|nr:hypothetical protein [Brevibacillus sp. AY1]MDH4617904.1 hypothetical protein [Brevibacillus sp. AY1]
MEKKCDYEIHLPSGCAFHTGCPHVMDICKSQRPEMKAMDGAGHFVACHLHRS